MNHVAIQDGKQRAASTKHQAPNNKNSTANVKYDMRGTEVCEGIKAKISAISSKAVSHARLLSPTVTAIQDESLP